MEKEETKDSNIDWEREGNKESFLVVIIAEETKITIERRRVIRIVSFYFFGN